MTDLYISSHIPTGQRKVREPYVEGMPFETGIKLSMKVIALFFKKQANKKKKPTKPKPGIVQYKTVSIQNQQ